MEVYKLDAAFKPTDIVEGWKSCIWTERWRPAGEIKLTTYKVQDTMALLPEGSYLSLPDTKEVVLVESHTIDPSDKGDVLTVDGRTMDGALFERRPTMLVSGGGGAQFNMTEISANDQWPTDLAIQLIDFQIKNPDGGSSAHVVPNIAASTLAAGFTHTGDKEDEFALYSQLSDAVLQLSAKEKAGIRGIRSNGSMKWEFYQGKVRTVGQATNPVVIFDIPGGHLIDPKYLLSTQGYKNVAFVVAPNVWQQRVIATGFTDVGLTGLDRRIVYVDAKSEIQSAMTTTKKQTVANRLGKKALAAANRINFVEGDISPASNYKRGVDFELGDKVTVMGNYGVSQTMLVSEYTRIHDEEGERAYPTLSLP